MDTVDFVRVSVVPLALFKAWVRVTPKDPIAIPFLSAPKSYAYFVGQFVVNCAAHRMAVVQVLYYGVDGALLSRYAPGMEDLQFTVPDVMSIGEDIVLMTCDWAKVPT